MISRRQFTLGMGALPLAACGSAPEKRAFASQGEIRRLEATILAMRDDVDPAEAARAAQIAFEHTRTLAIRYEIVDPPLIHNTKVNMGLNAENFETLEMKRAIAEGRGVRIDHSTAIISAAGEDHTKGVVLDPWRNGGVLFFAPVAEDTRYFWEAREVVLGRRRDLRELAG